MRERPSRRTLIVLVAAAALLLTQVGSEARRRPKYPDLQGAWTESYTTRQGGTGTLDVVITSDTTQGGVITGTLQDDSGPVLQLNGTISKKKGRKKPRWKTTATGSGITSEKVGHLVNNNRVEGTYDDNPGGTGTFVLNRVP